MFLSVEFKCKAVLRLFKVVGSLVYKDTGIPFAFVVNMVKHRLVAGEDDGDKAAEQIQRPSYLIGNPGNDFDKAVLKDAELLPHSLLDERHQNTLGVSENLVLRPLSKHHGDDFGAAGARSVGIAALQAAFVYICIGILINPGAGNN